MYRCNSRGDDLNLCAGNGLCQMDAKARLKASQSLQIETKKLEAIDLHIRNGIKRRALDLGHWHGLCYRA